MTLHDDIAALEKQLDPAVRAVFSLLRKTNEELTESNKKLTEEVSRLTGQVAKFQKMLFGNRRQLGFPAVFLIDVGQPECRHCSSASAGNLFLMGGGNVCSEGSLFCNFSKLMGVTSSRLLKRRRKFGTIGSMFSESRNFKRPKAGDLEEENRLLFGLRPLDYLTMTPPVYQQIILDFKKV